MNDVTRILSDIERDGPNATERLLPLVYDELRRLAAHKLAKEKSGHTLQPTALVHEVFLRLVDSEKAPNWETRGHFFGAAAEAMRRILVDHARQKKSLKRGGDRKRVDLDGVDIQDISPSVDILALTEALEKLEQKDRRKADLVKLRYFAGLTNAQAAQSLGISASTADSDWAYARCWLRLEMSDNDLDSAADASF